MNDNWDIPSEEWIAQQAQAPDWWKGDVADVEEVVKTLKTDSFFRSTLLADLKFRMQYY